MSFLSFYQIGDIRGLRDSLYPYIFFRVDPLNLFK